jgi:hypothetical protein
LGLRPTQTLPDFGALLLQHQLVHKAKAGEAGEADENEGDGRQSLKKKTQRNAKEGRKGLREYVEV